MFRDNNIGVLILNRRGKIFEFSNFSDGILEQVGTIISMPSAKQQSSNIKHGGGIRPNV